MDIPATRAVRRAAGLLRQRNFRLLWIGETISSGGDAMAVVGMPLLAVTLCTPARSRSRRSPRRPTCPG
jgi:hypothetical protein